VNERFLDLRAKNTSWMCAVLPAYGAAAFVRLQNFLLCDPLCWHRVGTRARAHTHPYNYACIAIQ